MAKGLDLLNDMGAVQKDYDEHFIKLPDA